METFEYQSPKCRSLASLKPFLLARKQARISGEKIFFFFAVSWLPARYAQEIVISTQVSQFPAAGVTCNMAVRQERAKSRI